MAGQRARQPAEVVRGLGWRYMAATSTVAATAKHLLHIGGEDVVTPITGRLQLRQIVGGRVPIGQRSDVEHQRRVHQRAQIGIFDQQIGYSVQALTACADVVADLFIPQWLQEQRIVERQRLWKQLILLCTAADCDGGQAVIPAKLVDGCAAGGLSVLPHLVQPIQQQQELVGVDPGASDLVRDQVFGIEFLNQPVIKARLALRPGGKVENDRDRRG